MNQKKDPETQTQAMTERDPRLAMPVIGGGLAPRDYGELVDFAKMVSASGMVPKSYNGNPGAVLVAVQMGAELGLAPMSSIRSICVINGVPSVWGDGLLALVVSHRDCDDVVESLEGGVATCTVKRRGRSPVTRTFSWDDAKRAGLDTKSGPWQQYPKRMLQMRARSWACRDAFPDVLRGIRATEEAVDAVDMGQATFVDPEPGPAVNPATAIPRAGTSNFGRAYGESRKRPPAEKPENRPQEPQSPGSTSKAAGGPKPTPAPEKSSERPDYRDVGPSNWPDEPEVEDEPRPSTPDEQVDAEGAGQGTLDGAGF